MRVGASVLTRGDKRSRRAVLCADELLQQRSGRCSEQRSSEISVSVRQSERNQYLCSQGVVVHSLEQLL